MFFRLFLVWPNGLASGRKWPQVELAWRLALGRQTDSQVSSQVHASRKKNIWRQTYPVFHWLRTGWWTSPNLGWFGLGGQVVKALRWPACKFDLGQSERKSSQVNSSARKGWSNGVASKPKLSTCLRLARAVRFLGKLRIYCQASWRVWVRFLETEA